MDRQDLSKLFPVLCVVIFYEKIFSWFFVWVNFGDSQTIFGTQAGRKPNVPVRYDLPAVLGNLTILNSFRQVWTVLDRFWTLFLMSKTLSKTSKIKKYVQNSSLPRASPAPYNLSQLNVLQIKNVQGTNGNLDQQIKIAICQQRSRDFYSQTFSHILKIITYIIIKKGPLDDPYIWIVLS